MLAFVRRSENDAVLVVVNVAASTQMATLHVPWIAGSVPLVDMICGERLAPMGAAPYRISVPGRTCWWFGLR